MTIFFDQIMSISSVEVPRKKDIHGCRVSCGVSAASYLAGSSDIISGRLRNAAAGTKIQIRTRSVDTSN